MGEGEMNKRKLGSFALCAMLLVLCFTVEAQQPKKVPRIGYLAPGSRSSESSRIEVFSQTLRNLGYVEGKNIVMEYRFAEGKLDRLPGLAAELVGLKVEVIVARASPAVQATKDATSTIPIVMAGVADAVRAGFVASLARPGGNITGLSNILPELAGKRLELLKDVIPKLSRVTFLIPRGGGTASDLFVKEAQDAGQSLGIQIQSLMVEGPEEFDAAFSTMAKERSGALVVQPLFIGALGYGPRIAGLAVRSRLPTVSDLAQFANEGGLMSYGPDVLDPTRRAAIYVDKILKGTKPADLPVEQPMKFELVINLKTAKQIGLTIPPNVLARADKVIK
jgi:putative ABC transport system substrate-binding protein